MSVTPTEVHGTKKSFALLTQLPQDRIQKIESFVSRPLDVCTDFGTTNYAFSSSKTFYLINPKQERTKARFLSWWNWYHYPLGPPCRAGQFFAYYACSLLIAGLYIHTRKISNFLPLEGIKDTKLRERNLAACWIWTHDLLIVRLCSTPGQRPLHQTAKSCF